MNKRLLFFVLFGLSVSLVRGENFNRGYRGYMDIAIGDAYNLNTAQTVSTNNMQLYSMVSTTHGYHVKNWFVGGGIGYYHSFRDEENMYPIYAAGRYTFGNVKMSPNLETRIGIVYDPLWIHTVQAYGALSGGIYIYKRLQVGLRLSIFSRPSRYFTANAAFVLSYAIGK